MGRSKPALGYKPQAKTAHIKRVYPGELPPLPPSYEAAVSQHHQLRYSSGPHGHAIQPPIYSSPAINDTAFNAQAPLVQQQIYGMPAIQQSTPFNNGTAWDAWGAKLVDEEKHYGGRFFEMNRPIEINAFNNASASDCFFNPPLGTVSDDIRDVVMITPSPSVVSMDVDMEPMNVDDSNAMDVDYVIVTSDDTAGYTEALPLVLSKSSEPSQRSLCKCQQKQPQHQNPPKQQQQQPQQQQKPLQQQQKPKHQNPPKFIPARSMYAPAVAEAPQPFPARPCLPMPKSKAVSPSKKPETAISTKVIPKTANCVAATCGRTTTTKNVERLVESFRRLNISDTFIHRSKPPSDRNAIRTVARPSSAHGVKTISTVALAPTVTPSEEVALVTFSCDDLVNLGSPRPATSTLSGVWEDLAGLEKAFVPAPPLVDDSLVTQSPSPSSVNTYGSAYSHIFELRDNDWSLSASSASSGYQEQVSFSPVVSVEHRQSITGWRFPKGATPSNKLKVVTRRHSTTKQKKTLVLGLPLNTLQQTRRKKKLAPCSSPKVVKFTRKVVNTMTAPFNGVIDTIKSSTEQTSKHDLLIKKALDNSRLYIPRRSPVVNKPTPSKVIIDAPRKVVSILDTRAPKDSRLRISPVDGSNVRSSLPTPPISPVREPRVRRRTSYTSLTTSSTAPRSRAIEDTESSGQGGNVSLSSSTPSPSERRRQVHDPRIYGRDYGREYISYTLAFSMAPSVNGLEDLAGTPQETPATVAPQLAESSHVPKVDDKVLPGTFPKVQKRTEEYRGPSVFEWLAQKVLGW